MGLLLLTVSMVRFSDGVFLDFCRSGMTLRCLYRLKEIDTGRRDDGGAGCDMVAEAI